MDRGPDADAGVVMTAGTKEEGGLWRPANEEELESFERELCAHCLDRNGEGDWEDEFGDEVPGRCVLLYYAFAGPTLHWTEKDGKRDCCCFVEDPANPARCPLTREMFP